MPLRSICVFCGSSHGRRPAYAHAARQVGSELARLGIRLVYGGGNVGLMGAVADAVMSAGGEVVGVIPQHLVDFELAHHGLTDLIVVGSMHERKAKMAEMADGFIALPGGAGTFEEFCEIFTWLQLGLVDKPCGLLNVAGYYDPMIAMFDRGVEEGFIREENRRLLIVGESLGEILDAFAAFRPPAHPNWSAPALSET